MIDMIDLKTQRKALDEDILHGLRKVLESGHYIDGPQVAAFEQEAAGYLGSRHAISCASGSDALWLSLKALGIGPGDEVITTAFSFFDTAEAILHTGAQPVFVDIQPDTWTINPALVEQAITPHTRAILPVHLFGQPADMELLQAIADHHELHLVEDASQAFGARCGSGMAGTFGDTGCFSFFPGMNLDACGDGGMITTQSDLLAGKLRALCNHGIRSHDRRQNSRKRLKAPHERRKIRHDRRKSPDCRLRSEHHHHEMTGHNSHLDEFQAVVLRARLRRLERYNSTRRYWASYYSAGIRDVPELIPPRQSRGGHHVFNQYTLRTLQRDQVYRALRSQGIDCHIHYPRPLYRQPALAEDYPGLSLPVSETVAAECLSLPIHPALEEDQVNEILTTLRETVEELAGNNRDAGRMTG